MTDTLTRAANDASEALGMCVETVRVPERDEDGIRTHNDPLVLIEVWTPLDDEHGNQPIAQTDLLCDPEALAYLEGLETGARIMRERHAELQEVTKIAVADAVGSALREALAELED